MEVENRLKCEEGLPAPFENDHEHNDQVIQRFTIFLTDEDENDLTIEEYEEEKVNERKVCDYEQPSSSYPAIVEQKESSDVKCVEKVKKKRGRKPKKSLEAQENMERDESDAMAKRRRYTFTCHHCSYISSWKTNLEKHLMAQHTGERPFRCPECDYCSVHQFQLEKHWSSYHLGMMVNCRLCSFSSSAIESYFKHSSQCHIMPKPHPCSECGRRTVSLSALELHMFEKHPLLPPMFECPHCPYKTFIEENLKNHIDALHQCSECSFSSKSLREVRRHKKKEHRLTLKMKRSYKKQSLFKSDESTHDLSKNIFETDVDSLPLNLKQNFPGFSTPHFNAGPPQYPDSHLESNKMSVIVSPGNVGPFSDPLQC